MSNAGRKTKYTPERVEAILTAIRETGLLREGYKAGDVTPQTFHRWFNEKREFSESVTQALDEYENRNPDEVMRLAKANLLEYLLELKTEEWKDQKTTIIYRYRYNKETEEWEEHPFEKHVEENVKHIRRNCPPQILERVLGKSIASLDAVKQLLQDELLTDEQGKVIAEAISELESNIKKKLQALNKGKSDENNS